MSKIKICGLTNLNDINYANEAMPDFIGFVFAKSKRQIDFNLANELKKNLSPNIKAVGVFVNEKIDIIKALCDNSIIDIVQLHGDENQEYIKILKTKISKPIIKAIRVENNIKDVSFNTDYILFDTFNKNQYGGSGESFNWNLVKNYEKPFFLAGGLNIGNIENAIKIANPYCVDISSGVETNGIKDKNKILELVRKVRSMKL
jgi:phosphoribosylanthranilate isomerase